MCETLPFDRGMTLEAPQYARLLGCRHRIVELDVDRRDVVCKRCRKVLDPFETLLMYAELGSKAVRRHDAAEDAAEVIRALVAAGGSVSISKRGTVASITLNGKRRQSSGGLAESLWSGVLHACRGLGFGK